MRDRWTWDLLDMDDQVITTLTTMTNEGEIALNLDADIRGGGRFEMREDLSLSVDWLTVRLRPTHWNLDTGESEPWGVYLPVVPTTGYTAVRKRWSGTMLDKTSILQASGPDQTYTVPAGTPIVPLVENIVRTHADSRIACTPSTAVTAAAMTFDVGDEPSWLTVCDTLLDAAAYEALWVDRTGQWRIQPYVLPSDRPMEFHFERGPHSTHTPVFDRTRDDFSTPNVVTCVGKGDGDTPPLVAVARNDNPDSPYSTVRRGREIAKRYTNVEASDQGSLYQQAQKYLVANGAPGTTLDIEHLMAPIWLGAAGTFLDRDVNVLVTVNEMRMQTRPARLCASKLTEAIQL